MSRVRHREPDVRGYAVTHPAGAATLPVEPGWDQLLYTASGVMTVTTDGGAWTIPPGRALWLPQGRPATVSNRSRVAVRNLYVRRDRHSAPVSVSRGAWNDGLGGPGLEGWAEPRAMAVGRFCREVLLHAVLRCPLELDRPVDAAC